MKNYYFTLGANLYASEAEIKKAYRKLALQYHPDRNRDPNAAAIFREINEAYEVLSDPQQKWLYDQQLVEGNGGQTIANREVRAHRDPKYKPKPPGYVFKKNTRKEEAREFVKSSYLVVLNISRVAFALVILLCIDFIFPASRKKITIEKLSMINTLTGAARQINGSNGETYNLGNASRLIATLGDQVIIHTSPLFRITKTAEDLMGNQHRIPVSIYGNFIFVPIVLLITSLIGILNKDNVEFAFDLGVINFFLIGFTVLLLWISK